MTINRDGKSYDLTSDELKQAYEEYRKKKWDDGICRAVADNIENLCFDEITCGEFVIECLEEIENRLNADRDDYEDYDDIVFDIAESNKVWID